METSHENASVDAPDDSSVDDAGKSEAGQEKRTEGSVKYENFQRVLGEKRKAAEENQALKAKIAEFEADEKRRKENELRKQNKYKELLELREKEANDAKSELQLYKQQRENAKKLDSVLKLIPGNVPSDYWMLIDTDKVLVDPESGEVDRSSADIVAKEFIERHSRLIDRPGNNAPPDNQAPQPHGSGKLTYEDWLKLSPADKKARAAELDAPEWMIGKGSHARVLKNEKTGI